MIHKEQWSKIFPLWKQIKSPLILLLLFFVFTSKGTELVQGVLVDLLMQSIDHSNIFIDFIILSISISMIGFFIYAARSSQKIDLRSHCYLVLIAIIYLYFRIPSISPFEFVTFYFSFLKWAYLADILLVPLIGLVLYHIFWVEEKVKPFTSTSGQRGFYIDNPVILDSTNDVFKRVPQITDLKNRLLATETTQRSFAISINGKWGSGKSTFIRTLRRLLQSEQGVITIDFNPWMTKGEQAITQTFFNDLSAKLSAFDRSLESEITDYSKELLNTIDNSTVKFLHSLLALNQRPEQLQDRYDKINKRIDLLRKKIIIFIDDIDRLGTEEIMDVLRIIRNTADFGNIYFIAAFDKIYVTKRMSDEISAGAGQYLEKIFQLEYYLSLHSQKGLFVEDLITKLKSEVLPIHAKVLNKILENDADFFVSEIKPPLENYLTSFRDVNRYMNVFVSNYKRIAANIYLPDYLSICLLRLKYPEVYSYLYYNKYDFLKGEHTSDLFGLSFRGYESGRLELRYSSQNEPKLENSQMFRILSDRYQDFAIEKTEISDIVMLVTTIFPSYSKPSAGFVKKRSLDGHHLSIKDASCFDRYFDFSMEGRIDQNDFDELFQKDLSDIKVQFNKWNENGGTVTDLQVKLENYEVFNSREEFEKVIRAILYFSDLPVLRNPHYKNQFNADNFYGKFGGRIAGNTVVQKFYNGDIELLRNFFKSLYLDSTQSAKWRFIHEFLLELMRHYDDLFIISHEEMKNLISECMLKILNERNQIDREVMGFYSQTIRVFSDQEEPQKIIPVGDGVRITEELKLLVLNDFNNFLDFCVYKYNPMKDGFVVGDWQDIIFGSAEIFMQELDSRKGDPKVDEFRTFYDQYMTSGKKPVINFSFQYVKPQ